MKAGCTPRWSVANRSIRDYSLPSLKLSLSLSLSLSLILSFEKERGLEDRSRSLDLSLSLGLVKTGRAPRWNVLNQRVHLKKSVHGRHWRGRSRCTKWESHWVGLVTRSPSVFLWRKRSVVMAPLHLQSQKLPHKTKWLWKVGPQVLPTRIFHKRSPLFQQECLRQGLHCTLEAHESCTFCAGRLIAGKVIKTLQTWRYVWSFTNLWRLNVIKWAGKITNLYKKFNHPYRPLKAAIIVIIAVSIFYRK